jgi:blocked-early-in-transport protein 1
MAEAYERERQNNARLDELSAKVSALRGVTVDIYDNARAQDVIHDTVRLSLPLSTPALSNTMRLTLRTFRSNDAN